MMFISPCKVMELDYLKKNHPTILGHLQELRKLISDNEHENSQFLDQI